MNTEDNATGAFAAPAKTAVAAEAALQAAEPSKTDLVVDRWFGCFYNSPVSRDTVIFNQVRQAVDDLKAQLNEVR